MNAAQKAADITNNSKTETLRDELGTLTHLSNLAALEPAQLNDVALQLQKQPDIDKQIAMTREAQRRIRDHIQAMSEPRELVKPVKEPLLKHLGLFFQTVSALTAVISLGLHFV